MLRQVKYFKLYWAVLRYFGLQPHKINQREKFRAIFIFLILVISNIVLYIIEFVTTDDDEARISALQTFPCFILIFIEGANVAFKSKEIEETFNEFNEVFSKAENQVLMQKGFKKFMIYVYFNHVITMISYLAGILLFLVYWFNSCPHLHASISWTGIFRDLVSAELIFHLLHDFSACFGSNFNFLYDFFEHIPKNYWKSV